MSGQDHRASDDGLFAFMLGMVLGAAAGGIAGVLLAPKKGAELREDVKTLVKALPGQVEDDLKNPQGKTRRFIDRTRYRLENQVDKVSQTIQANKMAEAKRREEMASGVDY